MRYVQNVIDVIWILIELFCETREFTQLTINLYMENEHDCIFVVSLSFTFKNHACYLFVFLFDNNQMNEIYIHIESYCTLWDRRFSFCLLHLIIIKILALWKLKTFELELFKYKGMDEYSYKEVKMRQKYIFVVTFFFFSETKPEITIEVLINEWTSSISYINLYFTLQ